MEALVQQPFAYLAGVLKGDAWLSAGHGRSPSGYFCLRVADREFADAFAAAITAAFGVDAIVNRDERGYWLCRKYNGQHRFTPLLDYRPRRPETKAAWLRGLFDSEGNANLTARPENGPRSFSRRVSFYSTDDLTLAIAAGCLSALGINSRVRVVPPSAGHLGSKTVFELSVAASRDAYAKFASVVGSSITRKQTTLTAIVESYCLESKSDLARSSQLIGAATKRTRTAEVRYPALLRGLASRIAAGESTTYRAVQHIDGYWAARKTLQLSHSQIIEEARQCAV